MSEGLPAARRVDDIDNLRMPDPLAPTPASRVSATLLSAWPGAGMSVHTVSCCRCGCERARGGETSLMVIDEAAEVTGAEAVESLDFTLPEV